MDQNARLQTLEQEQHKELVKLRAQQVELGEVKVLVETLRVQLDREKANADSAKETLGADHAAELGQAPREGAGARDARPRSGAQ